MAPALVEAFLKKEGAANIRTTAGATADEAEVSGVMHGNTSPTIVEIDSHGSSTAFADLLNQRADIGLSSRRIETEETQKLTSLGDMTSPATEHILGLDGIAVIVNRENQIESLTKDQVARIFSGEITDWSQVQGSPGTIKVFARDDKSGTSILSKRWYSAVLD